MLSTKIVKLHGENILIRLTELFSSLGYLFSRRENIFSKLGYLFSSLENNYGWRAKMFYLAYQDVFSPCILFFFFPRLVGFISCLPAGPSQTLLERKEPDS